MRKAVAVIGTLDTKGAEFEFLKKEIEKNGLDAVVIDCGVMGKPYFEPDIPNTEVAAAGGHELSELIEKKDTGLGIGTMAAGAGAILERLNKQGRIHGAISMGGGQGTFIGTTAMSRLPIGVPKVMISTICMVAKELFANDHDIMVMDPIVDVSGLNSVLSKVIAQAAGAVCGMVKATGSESNKTKKTIGITMFGVTTKCVDMIRDVVEPAGYELLVFHSTGIGGPNMESLIRSGKIDGVIDLTTAEVSQTYIGGMSKTTCPRMEGAADMSLPQVVSFGGMDVVNFLEPETVPERYRRGDRKFHMHNPATTLMRASAQEMAAVGAIFAEKVNKSTAPVKVMIPLKGISAYDKEGGVWYDPEADKMLFDTVKANLKPGIEVIEMDCHINDPAFAEKAAALMMNMLK